MRKTTSTASLIHQVSPSILAGGFSFYHAIFLERMLSMLLSCCRCIRCCCSQFLTWVSRSLPLSLWCTALSSSAHAFSLDFINWARFSHLSCASLFSHPVFVHGIAFLFHIENELVDIDRGPAEIKTYDKSMICIVFCQVECCDNPTTSTRRML